MKLRADVPMLAALAVFCVVPARADPLLFTLPVTATGPTSLTEGAQNVIYTFSVTNNTNLPLILDAAVALITPAGGDPGDQIFFSGPNGSNGLVNFPATLARDATGTFVYSVDAPELPPVPPEFNDFGLDRFSFQVEYSNIRGVANVPTINAAGPINLVIDGQPSESLDTDTLAILNNCFNNPATCAGLSNSLYPPSLNQGNPAFGGAAALQVQVNDIPEPASLALLGTAALAAAARRRRDRRGSA